MEILRFLRFLREIYLFAKDLLLLRSLWTGTVIGLVVLFLLFLLVKAGQVAVGKDVVLNAGISMDGILIQAQGFLAFAVQGYYLKSAGGSDGLHVGGKDLIGRVGDLSVQDIGLEEIVGVV